MSAHVRSPGVDPRSQRWRPQRQRDSPNRVLTEGGRREWGGWDMEGYSSSIVAPSPERIQLIGLKKLSHKPKNLQIADLLMLITVNCNDSRISVLVGSYLYSSLPSAHSCVSWQLDGGSENFSLPVTSFFTAFAVIRAASRNCARSSLP